MQLEVSVVFYYIEGLFVEIVYYFYLQSFSVEILVTGDKL